jgi:hypothetical protein
MKVTVDLSESELKEICFFTGEAEKGSAIRKMLKTALMMQRREAIAQKFISGKWGTKLEGFEQSRAHDRRKASCRKA